MIRIGLLLGIALLTACGGGHKAVAPVGYYDYGSQRGKAAPDKLPADYRVKKGDTLYSISWRYGMDYKTLARINHIRPPYRIYIGQKLYFKAARSRWHGTTASKKKSRTVTVQKKVKPQTIRKTTSRYAANQALNWRWPTKGKVISTYSKSAAGRKGIDIAGKPGQVVVATAAGKVVYSGNGLPRYGNLLIIKHNETYLSAYAHNRKLLVREGQYVKAGQKIALLGKTGTQRYKLHFEIRRNGKPVDPLRFLPAK